MKRYLVVLDFQSEEGVDPNEQKSVWFSREAQAYEYYNHYSALYVSPGKAGACSMYRVDWDRNTGAMGLPLVMHHCFNKFKKIVRYNAEKKSVMV